MLRQSISALLLILCFSCFAHTPNKAHLHSKSTQSWHHIVIHSGDTFTHLLKRYHLPQNTIAKLGGTALQELGRLHPRDQLFWQLNNLRVTAIQLKRYNGQTWTISLQGDQLIAQQNIQKTTRSIAYAHITITHSLSRSLKRAGLPSRFIADLQKLFATHINTDYGLRLGDSVSLLYECFSQEGHCQRQGHIIAAKLFHRGKEWVALRFVADNHVGYYDRHGHSTQLSFMKFPIHFKRISSRFSYHRMDPVLHRYASHLGIDLAAKTGTPIHSIGEGRIVFVGPDRGYGNAVKVAYGKHYLGLYAHMSRFYPHIHRGMRVHRGDVIGYVGQTGWATGPHLHFGFYINHRAVNWLTFKRPVAPDIPRRKRAGFEAFAHNTLATLELYDTAYRFDHTHLPLPNLESA